MKDASWEALLWARENLPTLLLITFSFLYIEAGSSLYTRDLLTKPKNRNSYRRRVNVGTGFLGTYASFLPQKLTVASAMAGSKAKLGQLVLQYSLSGCAYIQTTPEHLGVLLAANQNACKTSFRRISLLVRNVVFLRFQVYTGRPCDGSPVYWSIPVTNCLLRRLPL